LANIATVIASIALFKMYIAFGALLVWGAVWRRTTIIATCITPAPPRIFVTLTRKGRFHMLQAIGLCRFSYPALGGFQVEHETIEERIAYLYEEKRLEERFQLFETVALPCLKAQTDPNFDLIIVVGDQFPKQHMDRMRDMTAGMPQVQIQEHEPAKQRDRMKDIMRAARTDKSKGVLHFRYDDDDAVAVDFIEKLREAADDSQGLCDKNRSVAFDWHKGYVAEMSHKGIAAVDMDRQLYVASLGMHIRANDGLTIMNFAHEKINKFMPVVSYPDEQMWVRSHNGFNDSRQKKVKPVPVTPLTDQQEVEFVNRFAINADVIRETFAKG
jgi:hypothetical protein